jgi:hypothetical protein
LACPNNKKKPVLYPKSADDEGRRESKRWLGAQSEGSEGSQQSVGGVKRNKLITQPGRGSAKS